MNTDQLIPMHEIIGHFDLGGNATEITPLKIGHINDSFIISTDRTDGRKYLLQQINRNVFKDVDTLQRNILAVTDHLRAKMTQAGITDIDRRVLTLVPTRDGQLYYEDAQGQAWRVYVFIPRSHSMDVVNEHTAYLAGKEFGNFQSLLADIDTDQISESIPNFHNMEFRLDEFRQAVRADRAKRAALPESQQIIAEIERRADEMCMPQRLHSQGQLPKRINHCDTKVNNMLFDEHDQPLAIVDLDTVMPGFVLSDFGDFMRTAANTGAEDDPCLERVGVDLAIFRAFAKGFTEGASHLTTLEKSLLPFGAKWMTYMQAVRFFTDYLNGDTYYKTAYPDHNLVRTRAQMRLLQSMDDNYAQMCQAVE